MATGKSRETSVLMELPILPRYARRLAVEPSTCQLIIGPGGTGEEASLLIGKIVDALRPSGCHTYIQSVSEFHPFKDEGNAHDVRPEVLGDFHALRIQKDGVVGRSLLHWEAEAHAIFWGKDEVIAPLIAQLGKTDRKWWQFSREGYEAPYLRERILGNLVGFFARSHLSLQLIGTREAICDSFDTIRKLI